MLRYRTYSDHFRSIFGGRAQKLSVDAGFSCPNRDGSLARGGCTFCHNDAFTPSYLRAHKGITQQLDEGIAFHAWRYHEPAAYLAYFQSYSNTYAPLPVMRQRYEEALAHPKVKGLIISTRPDCVDEEKLDYIASLKERAYVAMEYGIESIHDHTLRAVNRGHDMACTLRALALTAERGIPACGHFILGLPGESRQEMMAYAEAINRMPLFSVKFHQLQLLKGTELEPATHLPAFTLEEYITLMCDIVERLRPDLVIERFASEVPPRFQADPSRAWRRPDGTLLRNEEMPQLINEELTRRGTCQGSKYTQS